MSLILKISDLWKAYNGNTVFSGCSFLFEKSGIYILMGPNGSGKSTFLRISALLEDADRGEIIYLSGQKAVEKDIGLKRRITLVLPKVGVFNTTVFKNMAFGLKIRGLKKKELEDRVNVYLESFGLIHKKNHNALTLSSGEAQRLGIARAMVTEPDILFLDEPTASVDQKNSEMIEEIILRMKNRGRPAVIMTTHDVAQAKRLADIMLVIREGRILAQGDASDDI
ncbi:MAG: ATP-binding cassette domain-containing protein [Nitrospirota bacterium]